MTPNEAAKEINRAKVSENILKYKREFKRKKSFEKFEINQSVLVKNENKQTKMDKEFADEAIIAEKLSENTYKIRLKNRKFLTRHCSQLKNFPRGKLDQKEKGFFARR
jgi:hypothetical protein